MNRANQLAALLLLVGTSRHYGWLVVDPQFRGIASKALGSIAALCLIAIIWHHFSSKLVSMVLAWYAFEEFITASCSVMYLIDPWPIEAGQSICSAKVDFDIGAAGIFVVGFLAYKLVNSNGTG